MKPHTWPVREAGERALKFSTWSVETVRTLSFQLFIQGLAGHQGGLAGAPGHHELGTLCVTPPRCLPPQPSGLLAAITNSSLSIFPEEEDGLKPKEPKEPKAAVQKELSDMDYLKSKVVAAESPSSEESEDEAVNCEEGSESEEEGSFAAPAQQDREAAPAKVCVDL